MKTIITDDVLLDFLDGLGSASERRELEQTIRADQAAQKRLKELEAIQFFLQNQKGVEQPSKKFTEKVMESLHRKPSLTFFSPKNGLLLLVGLMVASGLGVALLSSGTFDSWHTMFNINSLPVRTDLVKIPKAIPFDVKLYVKVFVMINLVIGLILLDRTILRPIFQKRSERLSL